MASGMYQLPLYFPAGTNATPTPRMYQLPRYHDKDDSSAESFDPVKQLETEQLDLIK